MRWKLFLLLLIGIMTCGTGLNASNSKTATFKGTTDQVFNAAVRVAQSKWVITYIDHPTMTFSFVTEESFTASAMQCGVSVQEASDGVTVVLNMQGIGNQQSRSGKRDQVASEFFKAIQENLSKQEKPSH